MPTVLRHEGFEVLIYTRDEHPPAHVHVWKAGSEAVIHLGDESTAPSIQGINRMAKRDARRAIRIVEDNQELFLARWRELHG